MSIYMTVFKCICMHEYMYVCTHVCIVCIYTCVYASMCICMYVYMYACVHTCIYVIFKLGFERYGGNCPSWEGELSGGIVRGKYPFPDNVNVFVNTKELEKITPSIFICPTLVSPVVTEIVCLWQLRLDRVSPQI